VRNVVDIIGPEITGIDATDQRTIDRIMLQLDGTPNKANWAPMPFWGLPGRGPGRAESLCVPLYRYIGGTNACRLPMPMMNILNGGVHAANNVDLQEFMIMPVGGQTFKEALRIGVEVFHGWPRC